MVFVFNIYFFMNIYVFIILYCNFYNAGMLFVDEMKLTKTLVFNRSRLRVEGFTDLGAHTPKHQAGRRGDHALVIVFQPFRG